ncbi:hypothetical protein PC129_g24468 [Phytophthora cactorum]|nr:hypothetical protein PC111_g24238 [Phytophthora cactorum]KAG3197824.1 hypothetical protein PC129_g24468 [Phytophthora cactorum]
MKLVIAEGFVLEPSAGDFRERVLALGKQAEKEVLDFLRKREITSRGPPLSASAFMIFTSPAR